MQKQGIAVFFAALLIAMALGGCSGNGSEELKDGTYRAEMKNESHGYRDYVEITVANGKIDAVVFDAVTSDGKKKSQDEAYKKAMMEGNKNAGVPETYPADYTKKLTQQLVEKQSIDQVDAVAGATTSSNDFKTLVSALMKQIERGKTQTVVVDNPQ